MLDRQREICKPLEFLAFNSTWALRRDELIVQPAGSVTWRGRCCRTLRSSLPPPSSSSAAVGPCPPTVYDIRPVLVRITEEDSRESGEKECETRGEWMTRGRARTWSSGTGVTGPIWMAMIDPVCVLFFYLSMSFNIRSRFVSVSPQRICYSCKYPKWKMPPLRPLQSAERRLPPCDTSPLTTVFVGACAPTWRRNTSPRVNLSERCAVWGTRNQLTPWSGPIPILTIDAAQHRASLLNHHDVWS